MTLDRLTRLLLVLALPSAFAGEADVLAGDVEAVGNNVFTFHVTVRHADTGWDHYADKWDIVTPDGVVLGTRVLHHPHVDEQPFTRSLSEVAIPENTSQVNLRAHDSVHGYGGRQMTVDIPR
jgi:hypothetical protein